MYMEERMKKERNTLARRMRGARALGLKNEDVKIIIRSYGPPVKPTASNLYKLAQENLRFSKTPVKQMGGEYFSRCGAEDGALQNREDARELAKEYLDAYRRVKGGVR